MARFSPKIEIINHFDDLINKVDIDIDSSLEKFNGELLSELITSSENNRRDFKNRNEDFEFQFFEKIDSSKRNLDSWLESMKVVDYLKQVRMKTIEELRKVQEETLEHYKINSARFKSEKANEKSIDELRSELFSDKFYFQINLNKPEKRFWAFNVFTFISDFYLSPSDIDSLEKLINSEEKPFGKDPVLNNKIVLTFLLNEYFIDNLSSNFPNRVIHVSKQDVLKIESIYYRHEFSEVNLTSSSTIDLSKLVDLDIDLDDKTGDEISRKSVKFNVEGLLSLKNLTVNSNTDHVDLSIKNLPSLTIFDLTITGTIDEQILTRLFDQVPHIQELFLEGNLSYFNLDSLVNLRKLTLSGTIDEKFNFELFKNLCYQLEDIRIHLLKNDEKTFLNLFHNYYFPYLTYLSLSSIYLNYLEKEVFDRFLKLRYFTITDYQIEATELDTFSKLKNLQKLDPKLLQSLDGSLFIYI